MSEIQERIEKLSPEQRRALEKMLTKPGTDETGEKGKLKQFYRVATEMANDTLNTNTSIQSVIRFAPFPEVIPGFSMIEMFYKPDVLEKYQDRLRSAQLQMMAVLFRGLDFSSMARVLDIGCGVATDLIEIAQIYPHLQLSGYNISAEQIEIGKQRIKSEGLADRISLYNRDSAQDPFPEVFDLAISFQVIHHIRNKANVFTNLGNNLRDGGYLVAAEILSNLPLSPIEEPESSAYFASRREWAILLAENKLRVVEAVDASEEIANCLEDANFEENWARITKDIDAVTKRHLRGPYEVGKMLRKKLAIYLLLSIQKDPFLGVETIVDLNQTALANRTPYKEAIAHTDKQGNPRLLSRDSAARGNQPGQERNDFRESLFAQDEEQVRPILELYVKKQIAGVTRSSPEEIDLNSPLTALGLDSLMFMELRNRVQKDLGIDIPVNQLMEESTISRVVIVLSEQLRQLQATEGNDKDDEKWVEGEI